MRRVDMKQLRCFGKLSRLGKSPQVFLVALPAILIVLHSRCAARDPLSDLGWLRGTWKGDAKKAIMIEVWERVSDSLMVGRGLRVSGGDTVFSESLRLQRIGDEAFYIADVAHNRREVAFKLVHWTTTEAVFENLRHDFPKRIVYARNDRDDLHVYIEGKLANENRVDFYFARVKE